MHRARETRSCKHFMLRSTDQNRFLFYVFFFFPPVRHFLQRCDAIHCCEKCNFIMNAAQKKLKEKSESSGIEREWKNVSGFFSGRFCFLILAFFHLPEWTLLCCLMLCFCETFKNLFSPSFFLSSLKKCICSCSSSAENYQTFFYSRFSCMERTIFYEMHSLEMCMCRGEFFYLPLHVWFIFFPFTSPISVTCVLLHFLRNRNINDDN